MRNPFKPRHITPSDAWGILDTLTPAQLCAALPTTIDQSKGFKLDYLGTEPIDSPIILALPVPRTSQHVYFIVEDFEYFATINHAELFETLTSDLDTPSYETIPELTPAHTMS